MKNALALQFSAFSFWPLVYLPAHDKVEGSGASPPSSPRFEVQGGDHPEVYPT